MKRLFKFIIVGTLNTAACLFIIFSLMNFWHLDYRFANATGYVIGYVISFTINRRWTFQHTGCWKKSIVRWSIIALIAYLCNLAAVYLFFTKICLNIYISQMVGVFFYTMVSFIGGRFFAFPDPDIEQKNSY